MADAGLIGLLPGISTGAPGSGALGIVPSGGDPTPGTVSPIAGGIGSFPPGQASFAGTPIEYLTQATGQVLIIPPVAGQFQDTPPPLPCPLFTASDYLQLVQFNEYLRAASTIPSSPIAPANQQGEDMAGSVGFGIPLEQNDFFRFRAYGNSVANTVTFFGRIRQPDGSIIPFSHFLNTNTTNTIFTKTVPTGAGFLLGAAASVPIGSITSGAVFAVGEIGKLQGATFTPHTLLFSGQITDQQPLTSTTPPGTNPAGSPQRFVTGATGSGATSLTQAITAPPGTRVRVTGVTFNFVNSAAAGARQYSIGLQDGSTLVGRWESAKFLVASQQGSVRGTIDGTTGTVDDGSTTTSQGVNIRLPVDIYFYASLTVIGRIDIPQAGDAIDSLQVNYECT